MVQIDVPAAFGIGHVFADAARRQLQTGESGHFYEALAKQNLFQSFCFSWIPVYFLINYFGWETTHMWWHADSIAEYPFFVPVFMVIFFIAGNAGFLLGTRLVRTGHIVLNRVIYFAILAFSTAWIFAQIPTSFRLGSYAEWKAGLAPWFWQDNTFLAMLIFVMVVWMSGIAYFYVTLYKAGKRLGNA